MKGTLCIIFFSILLAVTHSSPVTGGLDNTDALSNTGDLTETADVSHKDDSKDTDDLKVMVISYECIRLLSFSN